MKPIDDYLTISQLAKACSTSRSTILRMEEDGILTPAYINPENGYRYYDSTSILRVSKNMTLQEFGITHKELNKYYANNDYDELIHKLEDKLALMEYHITSLKLQLKRTSHLSLENFHFPELYCYTETIEKITDLTSVRPHLWRVFGNAVQKGYSINRAMHPFIVIDAINISKNNYQNVGYDYKICVPVLPGKDISSLEHFESCNTISVILYGGSDDMKKALMKLNQEMETKNLKSNGLVRITTVVASLPGEDIPMNHWVLRISLPFTSC